jgi:hypothetical protein
LIQAMLRFGIRGENRYPRAERVIRAATYC